MSKFLNIGYAIETINARLNGSSEEVESKKDSFNNTTFTKKIGGRAMVSAVSVKSNMKEYMKNVYSEEVNIKSKDGKQVKLSPNPMKYLFDDVFGFMIAEKISIEEDDYNLLSNEEKQLYKKNKKVYECNATKKRVARLQMGSLVNVSNKKVNLEFNVCSTDSHSMPYKLETYSGIMAGIANFNIEAVGEYKVSNAETEFRDYNEIEAKVLDVRNLNREEKIERIEKTLRALEYLSIRGNQTNHLTDTKPKFIILAEYSWGNNVFQGVIKGNGLDIEMLKESLDQNEEYRLSNVYIGVNKFFNDDFKTTINSLKQDLGDLEYVIVNHVHNIFDEYIKHLKESL